MIITSPVQLEAGKIYNQDDFEGKFILFDEVVDNYAFLVIREVTEAEFFSYVYEAFPKHKADELDTRKYFYEISTD